MIKLLKFRGANTEITPTLETLEPPILGEKRKSIVKIRYKQNN